MHSSRLRHVQSVLSSPCNKGLTVGRAWCLLTTVRICSDYAARTQPAGIMDMDKNRNRCNAMVEPEPRWDVEMPLSYWTALNTRGLSLEGKPGDGCWGDGAA